METNKKKTLRQLEGIDRWKYSKKYGSASNGYGTLWYPTGFGKTYTTVKLLLADKFLNAEKPYTVIILVHRVMLVSQWEKAIKDFLTEEQAALVKVKTVQSYIKDKRVFTCSLLIVDEVHKFYSEEFFSYVNGNKIKYKFLLCLTATYNDVDNRHLKLQKFAPPIDIITEEEAISNNWISKYEEYNLEVILSDDEIKIYQDLSSTISSNLYKFGEKNTFETASRVLKGHDSKKGFDFAREIAIKNGWNPTVKTAFQKSVNEEWNPNVIIGYAKKIFKAIRERKTFLACCDSKLDVVTNIIKHFNNTKIMSFSESTIFADKLFYKLNKISKNSCVVYHSQLQSRPLKDTNGEWIVYAKGAKKAGEKKMFGKTSLKKVFTKKFTGNECRILSTAKSLDEGFDCPDIQMAIISSRTKNPNQQKQRKGRAIRIIPEKPKEVMLIINVFITGTTDEESLRRSQKNSNNPIHWIQEIDEIAFEYKEKSYFL